MTPALDAVRREELRKLAEAATTVRLDDCPPGLFIFGNSLCFRSEYATATTTNPAQPDAYVVESGEYFWGGAATSEARSDLMVTPVDADTTLALLAYIAELEAGIEAAAQAAENYDRQPFPGFEAGIGVVKKDIAYRIRKLLK